MSLQVVPTLVAGFAGVLAMSILMRMATAMGMTRMPPIPLVLGAMMTDDAGKARTVGTVVHVLAMGTIVFGLAYGGLFVAFGTAAVGAGALIGLVHGVLVGAVAIPMMPAVHPRMSSHPAGPGEPVVTMDGGHLMLTAPGTFTTGWGGMTPLGIAVAHTVYGVVVASVYGVLA